MNDEVSLLDLFRDEVRGHGATLAAGLLEVEGATDPRRIEPLMRAAHSIKGAARIVQIDPAVRLAHVMEDVFVAAQEGKLTLGAAAVDVLLRGADLLSTLADVTEATKGAWGPAELGPLIERLKGIAVGESGVAGVERIEPPALPRVTGSSGGSQSLDPGHPEEPLDAASPLWSCSGTRSAPPPAYSTPG